MEMEMTYNSMPTSYYADRNISFLSKLVLERIWSLSKKGTQEVFFNRQVYATFFGANSSSISKCFKELIDNGYLREVKNKNPFDRTKKFYVINKQSTVEKSNNENVGKSNSDATLDIREKQYSDYWKSERSISDYPDNVHQIDHISKEKYRSESVDHTHSLSFDFNSIFSAMNEIKNEFTDYVFTDEEIRENAQSYLDKSQGYKFYKGKPTEAKLKAWLTQYLKQKKEKTSVVSGSGDLAKRLSAMNQINEMMSKRSHTEKKSDPIDADFEIIDEQKNALA